MSGRSNVAPLPRKPEAPKIITLTPEMAMQLLDMNTLNRPISDQHVQRIANQIESGKWKFNGDTIKVSSDNAVLDGQHRLWAVVNSKIPVETIIVHGIERDAFATIDTLRRPRSGADTVALSGTTRHRNVVASALGWLVRWQRDCIDNYRAPQNRIENSDIEEAFKAHPGIVNAVERASHLRHMINPAIVAFLYYVMTNRNPNLAEQMMTTLENPAGVSADDPFFRLRARFTAERHKRREPEMMIALTIKAANAAHRGQRPELLAWRNQGKAAEPFPVLKID